MNRPAALAAAAACVAGAVVLGGCSGSDAASPGTTSAPATTPASPAPGQVLAGLGAKGGATEFVADYRLDSTDPAKPDAGVTVYRLGSSYRVDVVRGTARSILLTAKAGLVSCQVEPARRTCLLVGGPGATPPKLFDPGLQRLFTSDLAAFAAGVGLTVTDTGLLPAAGALPAAHCFRVDGQGVDAGEYCLADSGILRKAQFQSGTLELTRLAGAPAPSAFVPPATPTPLPR